MAHDSPSPQTTIAGNWKMNGMRTALSEFRLIIDGLKAREATLEDIECALCLPATLIMTAADRSAGSPLIVGAQDAHQNASGAHTGDLSAEMLSDAGAKIAIIGHSERRADHAETDALVRSKVEAAWRAGMSAILCVGESAEERDAGGAVDVVLKQLDASAPDGADALKLVVAYEPVWAIGTGRTASVEDIAEMHGAIRAALTERFDSAGAEIAILYGGSVKPGNAAEILSTQNVNGALVGGASLKSEDFLAIVDAAIRQLG